MGLGTHGGDERHDGAGGFALTGVAERQLASHQFLPGLDPGKAGINCRACGELADACVAEADGDESLECQIVVGAVDHDRVDASPAEEIFELCLGAPAQLPCNEPSTVEDVEARVGFVADRVVPERQDDPGVFDERDDLDPLVGLWVEDERQIELALREGGDEVLALGRLADEYLDAGALLAESPKGGREQLGCRGPEGADSDARWTGLASLACLGGHSLNGRKGSACLTIGAAAGIRERNGTASARPSEEGSAQHPFQEGDLVGDRGLGVAQVLRRPAE